MEENKQPARVSFSKDKVSSYPKGVTGITATTSKASEPSAKISASNTEEGNISYSASDLLFKNLDALGQKFNLGVPEEEQELVVPEQIDLEKEPDWSNSSLDNLTEEEVIANLNQHLGYKTSNLDLAAGRETSEQNYLGIKEESQRKIGGPISSDFTRMVIPQSFGVTENQISSQTQSARDSFCRSCGGKYLATDNFCATCGNKRN